MNRSVRAVLVMAGSLAAAALSLAAVACGDSAGQTPSQAVASELAGRWTDTVTSPPGNSLVLDLTPHDTLVTGSGTFSEEALASGTIAITGLVDAGTINLDLTYSNNITRHIRATIKPGRLLDGIIFNTPAGDPIGITFRHS
jgi:hypothetical protein